MLVTILGLVAAWTSVGAIVAVTLGRAIASADRLPSVVSQGGRRPASV